MRHQLAAFRCAAFLLSFALNGFSWDSFLSLSSLVGYAPPSNETREIVSLIRGFDIWGEYKIFHRKSYLYTALTSKLFSFQSFFPFEFQFITILVIVPDQIPIEISICSPRRRRFLRLKINRRYTFLNITSSTVSRFLCFFVSSPAKTAPHPFPLTRTLHLPWQFQRDASNLRWTSRNFDEVSSIQARCSNQFRSIVYLTQFAARRAFATRLIIPRE